MSNNFSYLFNNSNGKLKSMLKNTEYDIRSMENQINYFKRKKEKIEGILKGRENHKKANLRRSNNPKGNIY